MLFLCVPRKYSWLLMSPYVNLGPACLSLDKLHLYVLAPEIETINFFTLQPFETRDICDMCNRV